MISDARQKRKCGTFIIAIHDTMRRVSSFGCGTSVLQEDVGHAAGMRLETDHRRLQQHYTVVTYDGRALAIFHAVPAARTAKRKKANIDGLN